MARQKLSKSRGGGPIGALAALDKYSADAVRYWAAGAGLGKDTTISEERIANGGRWVTKLWTWPALEALPGPATRRPPHRRPI